MIMLSGRSSRDLFLDEVEETLGKGPVTLRVECQRRGLKVSGSKPEMVERVEAHAIAKRGGYRCATTGAQVADGKPAGFTGGLPAARNAAAVVEA